MTKESFAAGIFYTLLAAAGTSLVGLLGKLGGIDWSLDALIFWRYVAATSIYATTLLYLGLLRNAFSSGSAKLHFLRAFFVLGSQYSFYYYIQTNPLLNGLVLLSLGPLFIPFIEWIVTRNRIGKSTWVGLSVSFLGMLLVLQPDKQIFTFVSLVGVLSGFCQGCSQVVFAMTTKGERPEISILNMLFLCTIFSFIPYLAFESPHVTTKYYAPMAIALVVGMGLATALNQLARTAAYKHGTPSRLATFMYFSILLGGIYDWAIFHRAPNMLSVIGALLVITGGALKIFLRRHYLKKR